jgi:hypothetical protein
MYLGRRLKINIALNPKKTVTIAFSARQKSSLQNNVGRDETTFAIAAIHHQNSSKT